MLSCTTNNLLPEEEGHVHGQRAEHGSRQVRRKEGLCQSHENHTAQCEGVTCGSKIIVPSLSIDQYIASRLQTPVHATLSLHTPKNWIAACLERNSGTHADATAWQMRKDRSQ